MKIKALQVETRRLRNQKRDEWGNLVESRKNGGGESFNFRRKNVEERKSGDEKCQGVFMPGSTIRARSRQQYPRLRVKKKDRGRMEGGRVSR